MQDRYLYRAKRTDNVEWITGYLYRLSENHPSFIMLSDRYGESHEVDPSTICQCTGLPDNHKKQTYENDIVKYEDGSIGIIKLGKYGVFHTGLYVEWVSETAMGYRNELGYWAPKVEVVGNIFDNPELLEVGE